MNEVHSTGVSSLVKQGDFTSAIPQDPPSLPPLNVRYYPMSQSSASNTASNFEPLLNAALAKYTKQTGKDLRSHPLADKIDSCDGPDSILDIFQEQAQAFDEFRNGDTKLFKWLRPVVNVLHALSTNSVLSDIGSLVSAAMFGIIHSRI